MDFVIHDPSISQMDMAEAAYEAVEGAGICVKILNPDGTLAAINRSGLAVLGEASGKVWVDVRTDKARAAAVDAVAAAFAGEMAGFRGEHVDASGQRQVWAVEAKPFRRDGSDAVSRIVVVSRPEAEPDGPLADALHDLSNVVTELQGAARILGRGAAPEMLTELASHLTGAGERASEALDALRGVLRAKG